MCNANCNDSVCTRAFTIGDHPSFRRALPQMWAMACWKDIMDQGLDGFPPFDQGREWLEREIAHGMLEILPCDQLFFVHSEEDYHRVKSMLQNVEGAQT